ncbi:hypothetical protein JCGZ_06411 [Jatropha curcas]|uniref:Uncharacterized protein n=1 Tax=Jatropha curcas TaxID=180498 RepID=A0A067JK00_JATCU|nr:hypothetical protein JCGZ_06411 [Jatropha curcas]
MDQFPNNNYESQSQSQPEGQEKNNGTDSRSSGSNGPHIQPPITTTTASRKKSNLKRSTTREEEINQSRTDKRKVSWPDAHGKDIAHIHEFEPRLSAENEVEI